MIRADYHMHTHNSGDSDAPMEAMIESAIAKGLERICITEHHDPDYVYVEPEKEGMFTLDLPAYRSEYEKITPLYADRIRVGFGVELGIQAQIADTLREIAASHPFDFIIASSHLCHRKDVFFPYFFEGRSVQESMTEYFESILENLNAFDDFDVYGHLDYAIRYAPEEDKKNYRYEDYADLLDTILKKIIEGGHGIEINTGGLRRGLESVNPDEAIVKRYRELGGEIITAASDAHEPSIIADHFEVTEAVLKRCGFRYYTVFSGRKPEFLPLE